MGYSLVMKLPEYKDKFKVLYKDIARQCGCTPEMISLIATEQKRPSFELAIKIEEATNRWVSHENWYQRPAPTATITVIWATSL